MLKIDVLPYYHPTTVVIIDNDRHFLDSVRLLLGSSLAIMAFTCPHKALQTINQRNRTSLDQRCLSGQSHEGEARLIRLDVAAIEQEIRIVDRFGDIAVVITDFDMPAMNGLKLLSGIKNPRIKKVLLTGVGDERIAVDAFNCGLINRFLRKQDPALSRRLSQVIHELQYEYFSEISCVLQGALQLHAPDFLSDPVFVEHFRALITQRNIVEYYFIEDPAGFLMVDACGQTSRLIVYNAADLERLLFRLRTNNVPDSLLRRIALGKLVPWPRIDSEQEDPEDWIENIYPCERLRGICEYLVAYIQNSPVDIDYDYRLASYDAFLAGLYR